MLEIFIKTVTSFVDKNLSALLLGAAGILILIFHVFKIPEKWEQHNEKLENIEKRLDKIDERQRRIFDFFKYSAGRVGNKTISPGEIDSGEFE